MNTPFNFSFETLILAGVLSVSPIARSATEVFDRGNWGKSSDLRKRDVEVSGDRAIERRRVTITQKISERKGPSVFRDDVEFEKLRRARIDKKTEELISQLETLIKRPGQQSRIGELDMRLAELYYERAQGIAAGESELWERQMTAFDKLSDEQKKKSARPVLKTPKADAYRRKSLKLYAELERMSRGSDHGARQQIRRDEVLFFLGSTLLDLGSRKQGMPYFDELVNKFPKSERAFAARLTLADLLFEESKFDKASSHYLRIAAGESAPADSQNLKPYALYKLAWCYLNMTQYEKSVMAFQKTLEESRRSKAERRVAFEHEALNDLAWAFALAGMYDKGEDYFDKVGSDHKDLQVSFRKNAAEISRDRGEYDVAKSFFTKLLKADRDGAEARYYALELADIYKRQGDISNYAKALADVGKNYGEGSRWLDKYEGTSDEKKSMVEDLVTIIRREAKNAHASAQKKDKPDLYQKARPLYDAYFKVVPEPNPDSKENIHEMHFYYGELLFKVEDYKSAANAYAETGEGKYGSQAAYARILALRNFSKKDSSASKDLARATQDFVKQYPEDDRAGEIMYSGAYDAFNAGQTKESLATLRKLTEKFADGSRGVESAERILFIHEKSGDLDLAIKDSDAFLKDDRLLKAGGKEFEGRLKDYQARARFKKIDKMDDSSDSEKAEKARAYLDIAKVSSGETKEKALNNALVFAKKTSDKDLQAEAQTALIKSFPSSAFAKDIYFQQGEAAAKNGQWAQALKNYDAFLKAYKNDSPEAEKALWNSIFIRAQLEDVALPRLYPVHEMSGELLQDAKEYLGRFPKGPNRSDVLEFLAFRKSATLADLKNYEKIPSIGKNERDTLEEASVLIRVRARQDLDAIVKKYSSVNGDHMKEALAVANFAVTEPKYDKYRKNHLNYKNFAPSLRGKLDSLEKLEKDYLRVVGYGNGELALKSLQRLSSLYRTLAGEIDKAPAAKEELAQFSKPMYEKGTAFLMNCVEKAQEFKIGGAGLDACKQELVSLQSGANPGLSRDMLVDPKWIAASSKEGARPLFKVTTQAFASGKLGEFSLGASLLEKADPAMTSLEKAEIDNMNGLWNWRVGKGQAAVKLFRKVSDLEGSEFASVRTAAFKNLAALYLQVGDYTAANETAANLSGEDADAATLQGLALRALGKNSEAADAFDRALRRNKNNPTLLYNKALSLGAANQYAEAAQAMQNFIELETPDANHPSRVYLRKWRSLIK